MSHIPLQNCRMVNVGARIRERREQLGWSGTKLATVAEVNQSMLSRVERGKRRFNDEDLQKVAGALGVSVDKLYISDSNVTSAAPDHRRIPVIDYVQAGNWTEVRETLSDGEFPETIGINLESPPSTFALRIKGDSMMPEFRPGDLVIIAPTVQPHPGDYVVATDENGEATFKRYREIGKNPNDSKAMIIELVALNPDYPSMRSDVQQIGIVGVMIEHRKYRQKRT